MSKKHYEKIAQAIKRMATYPSGRYLDLVDDLCVIFEEDNDKFNSDKFREACGIAEVYHG